VLTRLENVLKGDDAPVPAPLSDAVIEPVIRSAPPQAALNLPANAETPADPAASVQATLLALLSQASNVPMSTDGPQTTANNVQSAQVHLPHLDANQLKLFQQLTQSVNSEVTTPPIQTLPPPLPAPTSESEFVAGPSNPPAYWNNLRNAPDKPWDASQVVEENNYHGHRGRFRGGYRSRGRGRNGDRDRDGYRDRFHDTARSPPAGHGRNSRSRSPSRSRYGGAGRRDVKPYSPPHRPSLTDQADHDADTSSSHLPGVDEFGREIRPSSDDDGSETPDNLKSRPAPPPPTALAHLSPTSAPEVEGVPVSGEQEPSAIATPQAAASAIETLHHDTGEAGLQSFDYSSFDPTLPSSWEALGNAWAATNGRQPLQEELMMFVMEFTVSMANQVLPSGPAAPAAQANQWTGQGQRWTGGEPRGGGPPPRGGRGRGGAFGTRGGGRRGFNSGGNGGQTRWDYGGDGYADMDANGTDAIVLGEHTNDVHSSSSGWAAQDAHEQVAQAGPGEEGDGQMGSLGASGASGGRMQKVGDNWVFVRDDGSS
jgi:protein NRD1